MDPQKLEDDAADENGLDRNNELDRFWMDLAADQFNFQARGAQGNPAAGKFDRLLPKFPKDKAAYSLVKGTDNKKAFRAAFMKERFEE